MARNSRTFDAWANQIFNCCRSIKKLEVKDTVHRCEVCWLGESTVHRCQENPRGYLLGTYTTSPPNLHESLVGERTTIQGVCVNGA